jgi:beta-lactamase superfamily II metal-dependent hydrolase
MKKTIILNLFLIVTFFYAAGQANGKLQLHFIDVGQGDAAVLISPKGEVVLFDDGVANYCNYPVSYLKNIGIKNIDYLIISHYHDDHIGCTQEVLAQFPLKKKAYDRGEKFKSSSFDKYISAVGTHRQTAVIGNKITLDSLSNNPVYIQFVAMNGNEVKTTNENDLSLVCVIHFGKFDVEMGGDLSGLNKGDYSDIESTISNKVQQVEVYKVHHHGSQYSSNSTWLSVIKPRIGIISASDSIGHNYHHPTADCLKRLHNAGIKTYWTETGGGVKPDPQWDKVGGNIIVEAAPNSNNFTVTYDGNKVDTYFDW